MCIRNKDDSSIKEIGGVDKKWWKLRYVRKKIDAVTKNFIAVEAKISDWKAGLEQAIRYKQYANEVYVAISSEFIDKVDKEQFKKMNIGLMSVSDGKLRIPIRARKQKVEKLDIQYYIEDRFLKQLQMADICE